MTASRFSSSNPSSPAVDPGSLRQAISDGLIVTWRNLKRVPRIPELAILAVLQSIMFGLLFAFVFGGAIPLPDGGSYREFLMPGIFAQTVIFASVTTAIGITDDLNKGIIDRFRSLPMACSAVLTGRALFDLVYNAGILVVLMLSGLAVGWRVHSSVPGFFAGVGLLLLFTFAMSWIGVLLGLSVRTVEAANQVGFTVIFPYDVSLERIRTAADPTLLASASRGVESGQRSDSIDPRAVGEPKSVRVQQLSIRTSDPADAHLGSRPGWGVRSTWRETIPIDQSLAVSFDIR